MLYTTVKNRINNNTVKYQFARSDSNKLTYAEFIQLLKARDRNFIREFDQQLSRAPAELSFQPTAYF
jgi:hypothetical protein